MDDRDNEEFLQRFMRTAQERQARLAAINRQLNSAVRSEHEEEEEEPSYPHLSPLTEEGDTLTPSQCETTHQDESSITDGRRENISPGDDSDDLNYSSDLSLGSDTVSNNTTNEIYRAEPVRCHSPPNITYAATSQRPQSHYGSPRKASAPPQEARKILSNDTQSEQCVPLQERQTDHRAASLQSLPTQRTDEQVIQDLEAEINKLDSTIHQLKMALEESKYGTPQHIVGARLLKIDECKHRLYSCHRLMLQKGVKKRSDSLGSLKITDLKFRMTDKFKEELAKPGNNHNFFCIASFGADVKATRLVDSTSVKQQATKDYVEFNSKLLGEQLHFKNLPPDFVVKLELFELIIHPGSRGAIIKDSFEKISAFATPSKKPRTSKEVPRFRSIGNLRLTRRKEDHRIPKLARMTDDENSKYISKEYQIQMELRPEQLPTMKGMLHMSYLRSNGVPDWTRRWVHVSNGHIKMWNSDRDALEGKEPILSIGLEDLCTESVRKLTVNHPSYRPNSFALYSKQQLSSRDKDNTFQRVLRDDSNCKIVMFHLAANDKEERDCWCNELNRSIHCFSEWHDTVDTYSLEEIEEMFSR